MAHNRIENIRAYVAPDRLDRLEHWPDVHEALSDNCHLDSNPDLDGYFMSGHSDRDPTVWHHSLWFIYHCPDKNIVFTVDMTLQQIDGNWYITDWGKICEEYSDKPDECW